VCIYCNHKYAVRKIRRYVPQSKLTLGKCIISALIDLHIYMYIYIFSSMLISGGIDLCKIYHISILDDWYVVSYQDNN